MTNPNYTAICLLIDRSGSMASIKEATEQTINSFIRDQANADGERTIRIMTFDAPGSYWGKEISFLEEFCPSRPAHEILEVFTLEPRGNTALLDAMGKTISIFGKELADMPEDQRPGHVILATMTDGIENSSQIYTWESLKEIIEHQKEKYSWDFIYLGANQDAIAVAGKMGINRDSALTYSATTRGVHSSGTAVGAYVASSASGLVSRFTDEQRKDALEEQ